MTQSQPIIGIPRALLYHKYGDMWQSFFRNLNVRVIVSPPTNKEILSDGLSRTIDENCLPMKIFIGHVNYLRQRTTHIFIPRIASLQKNEENCMKLWALYDNVATIFPDIKIITYSIDRTKYRDHEMLKLMKVGLQFNKNPFAVYTAYRKAKNDYLTKHREKIKQHDALFTKKDRLKILIVAHPYVIHDEFIGRQIINFLQKENINVLYAHLTDSQKAKAAALTVSKDLYWTYHKDLVGSIAMHKKQIDGIVYLMAFSCGPDALVVELCKRTITNIPSVIISLDELQSDGGIVTRLESFIDIIRFNQKKKRK